MGQRKLLPLGWAQKSERKKVAKGKIYNLKMTGKISKNLLWQCKNIQIGKDPQYSIWHGKLQKIVKLGGFSKMESV